MSKPRIAIRNSWFCARSGSSESHACMAEENPDLANPKAYPLGAVLDRFGRYFLSDDTVMKTNGGVVYQGGSA